MLLLVSFNFPCQFYASSKLNIRYVYKIAEKVSHQKHLEANMTMSELIALWEKKKKDDKKPAVYSLQKHLETAPPWVP
jgi:hypothetical protein